MDSSRDHWGRRWRGVMMRVWGVRAGVSCGLGEGDNMKKSNSNHIKRDDMTPDKLSIPVLQMKKKTRIL